MIWIIKLEDGRVFEVANSEIGNFSKLNKIFSAKLKR